MLNHTSPTCMLEEVSVFSNENKNEFRENKKIPRKEDYELYSQITFLL